MSKNSNNVSGPTRIRDQPRTYHEYYDPECKATLSETVITAIADIAGVDPTRTRIPLNESVNPDALNELFDGRDGDAKGTRGRVVFATCGLEVTAHSNGHIIIRNAPRAERPTETEDTVPNGHDRWEL